VTTCYVQCNRCFKCCCTRVEMPRAFSMYIHLLWSPSVWHVVYVYPLPVQQPSLFYPSINFKGNLKAPESSAGTLLWEFETLLNCFRFIQMCGTTQARGGYWSWLEFKLLPTPRIQYKKKYLWLSKFCHKNHAWCFA
jgi:hypothetical protein